GATYPDVTLLPALARLLKMDMDALFGFRRMPDARETAAYLNEVLDIARRDAEAGFARAQALVREYPDCGTLLYGLAAVLEGSMQMAGTAAEQRGRLRQTLTEWYERAAECGDEQTRVSAAYMLAGRYMADGETEKARAMIDRLPERKGPERWAMEVNWLLMQERFDEAEALIQRRLLSGVTDVQALLMRLADVQMELGERERAECVARKASDAARLFDLWEYNAAVPLLQTVLRRRDAKESVAFLRVLLEGLVSPWNTADSPLYDRLPAKEGGNTGAMMLPGILAELENSPEVDFLREDEAFHELLNQYKGQSGQE
ncbi:MAG: hypothetical protein Q4F18_13295, partial [Clostridia bacterium]|nr:hypothetical protein [Clostridia bacterium]